MRVPQSLTTDELAMLWTRVRDRLEHNGDEWKGRVGVPALSAEGRLTLESLVGRRLKSQVALGDLEAGLVRLGVG